MTQSKKHPIVLVEVEEDIRVEARLIITGRYSSDIRLATKDSYLADKPEKYANTLLVC